MEAVIMAIIFGSIFGIVYLYFSTRNKERLALIEKGADASIFVRGKSRTSPIWKVFILNLALLLMGIGTGMLLSLLIQEVFEIYNDILYAGTIFLVAGASLFIGFNMTKKLDKE